MRRNPDDYSDKHKLAISPSDSEMSDLSVTTEKPCTFWADCLYYDHGYCQVYERPIVEVEVCDAYEFKAEFR